MIVEAMISAAPILTPFAAGVLSASIYGLRQSLKKAAPSLLRIEPVFVPPPAKTDALSVPEAVNELSDAEERTALRKRTKPKLIVTPGRAAEYLISFMNGEGQTGLFTSKEIDMYWDLSATMNDLEPMDGALVREALETMQLRVGQRRLKSPEFAAVRQRNPSSVRPVLYRIPKIRAKAERPPDSPSPDRTDRKSATPKTGQRSDSVQSSSQEIAA